MTKYCLYSPPKIDGKFIEIDDCCWGFSDVPPFPNKLLNLGTLLADRDYQVDMLFAGQKNMNLVDVWRYLEKTRPDYLVFQIAPQFEPVLMPIVEICYRLGIIPKYIPTPDEYRIDQAERIVECPQLSMSSPIDFDLLPNVGYNPIYQIAEGCPHGCTFCVWAKRPYRIKRPAVVIDDIKELLRYERCADIYLLCSQITTNKKWLEEFTYLKQKENIKFNYVTDVHAGDLDDDMVRLLKESGCINLYMGMESSNQDVLDEIEKELTIKEIENAIDCIRKQGFFMTIPFLYNLTDDENVYVDIDFCNKQKIPFSPGIAKAYPGTQYTKMQNGKFDYIFDFGYAPQPTRIGLKHAEVKVNQMLKLKKQMFPKM